MQFNEFNRRLYHCHLDPETKFLLTHMFEVQVEFSKHLDVATTLMGQLADKIQTVLGINDALIEGIRELQRRGMADGVEVHSVANDPEDDK
jgi:phage-related minor tail protein